MMQFRAAHVITDPGSGFVHVAVIRLMEPWHLGQAFVLAAPAQYFRLRPAA